MTPGAEPITQESPAYGFFAEQADVSSAQPSTQAQSELVEQEATAAYGFFADDPGDASADVVAAGATDGTIDLGAELTIRSIADSKAMIEQALATGEDIHIDISQLQRIDSSGVQMIYSLVQTLAHTSQSVSWVGSHSMIDDASRLLGMPPLLDDQQATAAFGFFADDNDPGSSDDQEQDGAFGFF